MRRQWQLQEAKARLSELVRSAATDGPQEITVHGRTAAVLLSKEDYDRLRDDKPSFVELIRSSPLVGVDLDIRRNRSPMRKVKL
jgi:prevent-host-death family protein